MKLESKSGMKYKRAIPYLVRVDTTDGVKGIVRATVTIGGQDFTKESTHKRKDLWLKQAHRMCKLIGVDKYTYICWGKYDPQAEEFSDLTIEDVKV